MYKRLSHGALGMLLFIGCAPHAPQENVAADGGDQSLTHAISHAATVFVANGKGQAIAVLEFPNLHNDLSDLGRFVSEQMTTAMVEQGGQGAAVVERRQVLQVLRELDLSTKVLSPPDVVRVGRRLGAKAVVLGSAVALGDHLVVNARLVDVETMNVIAADNFDVRPPRAVLALEATGVSFRSSSPSAGGFSGTGQTTGSPIGVEQHDQFEFALRQCTIVGAGVTCAFQVTNRGNDRDVRIFDRDRLTCGGTDASTRAFDDAGNVTQPTALRVGRNVDKGDGEVRLTLIQDVPVQGQISFEGATPTTQRLPRVQIGFAAGQCWTAVFRNVPLGRG